MINYRTATLPSYCGNRFAQNLVLLFPILYLSISAIQTLSNRPDIDELYYLIIGNAVAILVLAFIRTAKPLATKAEQVGRLTANRVILRTKLGRQIPYVLTLISALAAIFAAAHIYSRFGGPLILLPGSETIRLTEAPVSKYVALIQSVSFISLPICAVTRKKGLFAANILSMALYSFFVGSRAPILFATYVIIFYSSRVTSIITLCFAIALFFAKAIVFKMSISQYAALALSAQMKYLVEYIQSGAGPYFGYYTFLRPFLTLAPGHWPSLINLQESVLRIHFAGLLVATGYVYPYLDFGPLSFVLFPTVFLIACKYILTKSGRYPTTSMIVSFSYVLLPYDLLLNKLYFILIVISALIFDRLSLRLNHRQVVTGPPPCIFDHELT